jgi:transposase-like protein
MSKTYRPYSEDFKKQAVDLALSNPEKSLKQIASELGVSVDTLRDWKMRTLIHGDSADLVPPPKDDSLEELKRVNRQLRDQLKLKQEANDILKKAIAICSELPGLSTPIR